MTRRRLLLIALPLAVAVIVSVLAMLPARPGVTKTNFDRIEVGMTSVNVVKLLGDTPFHHGDEVRAVKEWQSLDGMAAAVWFTDDKVTKKEWADSPLSWTMRIELWLSSFFESATQS